MPTLCRALAFTRSLTAERLAEFAEVHSFFVCDGLLALRAGMRARARARVLTTCTRSGASGARNSLAVHWASLEPGALCLAMSGVEAVAGSLCRPAPCRLSRGWLRPPGRPPGHSVGRRPQPSPQAKKVTAKWLRQVRRARRLAATRSMGATQHTTTSRARMVAL